LSDNRYMKLILTQQNLSFKVIRFISFNHGISKDYRFVCEVVLGKHMDPETLINQAAGLDGMIKISGVITNVRTLARHDDFHKFRITLHSPIHHLKNVFENTMYVNKGIVNFIGDILGDCQLELKKTYEARASTAKYNISDFEFFNLLAIALSNLLLV